MYFYLPLTDQFQQVLPAIDVTDMIENLIFWLRYTATASLKVIGNIGQNFSTPMSSQDAEVFVKKSNTNGFLATSAVR